MIKVKMLWLMFPMVGLWYRTVWKQDENERMCCNGYECGCMGADFYSYWEWLWKTRKDRR
jgi:hypothetical protein